MPASGFGGNEDTPVTSLSTFSGLSPLRNATSEEKFRLLVQSTAIYGMFLIDPDKRIASWNEGARRIFGYEEAEIVGQPADIIFTPEDRVNGIPEREVSTAEREGRAADVRWHLRKDGTRFWADGVMERLTDAEGNFAGLAKVLRDATRDKESTERLADSEAKYRTLFDTIDVGFCVIEVIFDDRGRPYNYLFLDVNPAFERHTGLVNGLGRTVNELVPNLDDFWFQTYGSVALTGEAKRFESHAPAMGRWFDVYTIRVGNPTNRQVAIFFTDITARREAQLALSQSEAQLRDAQTRLESALSAGNIATWSFDVVNNRVVADANLARLFSVDPVAAAGGKLEVYLQAIHPDDRDRVTAIIGEAIACKDNYEAEYRVVLPDGTSRWLVARGTVERDADGAALALPGVVIDVTERVEEQRREQFLADFTLRAQTLTDPEALIADAVQSLGAFLHVARCVFYDVDLDTETINVHPDYRADDSVVGIAGVLPLSVFGPVLTTELKAGHNFVVNDVRTDNAQIPQEHKSAYESISIRALAVAPAVSSDRLVSGMGIHSAVPRRWMPEEVLLLRSVAEQTWLRAEVLRQQRALEVEAEKRRNAVEHERSRLSEIFLLAPAFMAVLRGPEHRYENANLPYYRLIGRQDDYATQAIVGKTIAEVIPEIAEQGFIALLDQVYQTGTAYTGNDTRVMLQSDGDAELNEHYVDFTFQPLREDDGSMSGVLIHGVDLTDRKLLEQERERLAQEQQVLLNEARARAEHEALLNQISEAVRGSLDPDEILQSTVAVLGRGLEVDRCYFVRYDQDRDIARVTPEWFRADAQLDPLIGRTLQMSTYSVDRDVAYKSGRPHVVNDVVAYNPGDAAPLLAVGIRSILRVPIEVGNQMTALAVAMAREPRQWTGDEIRLVENVAALVRSAMESAMLQQRERNIAVQLQEALQPPPPTDRPGLALASYYRPALAEASVGGDFFDVFPITDGCTALVVADLSGKGLAAASQVSTVRNMLRYAVYSSPTLAAAVTGLHEAIVTHDLLTGFATLFVGVYDEQEQTLAYVNCGQEPGLVFRAATATLDQLPSTGPVLGGFGTSGHEERRISLAPGDVLALFTDGLTEVGPSRKEQLEIEGVGTLFHSCCQDPTLTTPQSLVDCLISHIDTFSRGGVRDDIALLIGLVGP